MEVQDIDEDCDDYQEENADNVLWVFKESGGFVPNKTVGGEYYVYFVGRHAKYDVVYIGSGTGGRHKHTNSGTSHNYMLNALHHKKEEATTFIVMDGLTQKDSLYLEKALIAFFNPEANTMHITKMQQGQGGNRYGSPFRSFLKQS